MSAAKSRNLMSWVLRVVTGRDAARLRDFGVKKGRSSAAATGVDQGSGCSTKARGFSLRHCASHWPQAVPQAQPHALDLADDVT